jgi:hypothetical protein
VDPDGEFPLLLAGLAVEPTLAGTAAATTAIVAWHTYQMSTNPAYAAAVQSFFLGGSGPKAVTATAVLAAGEEAVGDADGIAEKKPTSANKETDGRTRFVGQPDGQVVDTEATPPGSYDQPNGGRTDILQNEDHGAGQSHTHDPILNRDPVTGRIFLNGRQQPGRTISSEDIDNIRTGAAPRSRRKGR